MLASHLLRSMQVTGAFVLVWSLKSRCISGLVSKQNIFRGTLPLPPPPPPQKKNLAQLMLSIQCKTEQPIKILILKFYQVKIDLVLVTNLSLWETHTHTHTHTHRELLQHSAGQCYTFRVTWHSGNDIKRRTFYNFTKRHKCGSISSKIVTDSVGKKKKQLNLVFSLNICF